MVSSEYDIALCRPEHTPGIVDVVEPLLGGGRDERLAYFAWKYADNPHSGTPPGVVALHGGKVVGFRGGFVIKWRAGETTVRVLSISDSCVDAAHRRKGLSVAMAEFLMNELAAACPVIMNTTCGKASYPGYVRMGFAPVASKTYLNRYGLAGLAGALRTAHAAAPLSDATIKFGAFGDVVVSDGPRPEDMAAVIAREPRADGRLRLCQDEAFFRWRFGSPRSKYVFYYWMRDGVADAYVVMGVSPNNRRGVILDCAGGASLDDLLRHVAGARDFGVISIYHFCAEGRLLQTLSGLGFKAGGLLPLIERSARGEFPLLVRPAKPDGAEGSWTAGGLDVRNVDNWSFKGICSDAA